MGGYRALMGEVLCVNYWGEVLAEELLAALLPLEGLAPWRELLAAQREDEARHAAQTRALLLGWGRDPLAGGRVEDFTFFETFRDFRGRGALPALCCLCENELLSARHFAGLCRVARRAGDPEVEGLYRQIVEDESRHGRSLGEALPDRPELLEARREARERMEAVISTPYLRLMVAYPPARRTR